MLHDRAEHVERNRDRFVKEIGKAVQQAAERQRRLIDELEQAPQETIDLRATEVWVRIFPHPSMAPVPNTTILAGAAKRVQTPILPGVEQALPAAGVFELLRADVDVRQAASVEQAAAERGVTPRKLGREAQWQQDEPDYVGPDFGAAWGGSPEEKQQTQRVRAYARRAYKRLWGEEPGWGREEP